MQWLSDEFESPVLHAKVVHWRQIGKPWKPAERSFYSVWQDGQCVGCSKDQGWWATLDPQLRVSECCWWLLWWLLWWWWLCCCGWLCACCCWLLCCDLLVPHTHAAVSLPLTHIAVSLVLTMLLAPI